MTAIDIAEFGIEVKVSEHALWRGCERFRLCTSEAIAADVLACFRAGGVTTRPPRGVTSALDAEALYCRSADGGRVYVVKIDRYSGGANFVVLTCIRPQGAPR